jgi:hypothetical protein
VLGVDSETTRSERIDLRAGLVLVNDIDRNAHTYRTVEHVQPCVARFLDMTLQRARVERLQQLEAAKKL